MGVLTTIFLSLWVILWNISLGSIGTLQKGSIESYRVTKSELRALRSLRSAPLDGLATLEEHGYRNGSIALLFTASSALLPEKIWKEFLSGARSSDEYVVYIHVDSRCEQRFPVGSCTFGPDSIFYGREVRDYEGAVLRIPTPRFSFNIVLAMKLLLREAYTQRPDAERFVFLSDSSVPLWPFETVRSALLAQPSMISVADEPAQKCYNMRYEILTPGFKDAIPREFIRCTSQWHGLTRRDASVVLADEVVQAAFLLHECPTLTSTCRANRDSKKKIIVPDESYFGIVLTRDANLSGRELVYASVCLGTHWIKFGKFGGHASDFEPEQVHEVRSDACGEPFNRHGGQQLSSEPLIVAPLCHLFARKFLMDEFGEREAAFVKMMKSWGGETSQLVYPVPCMLH